MQLWIHVVVQDPKDDHQCGALRCRPFLVVENVRGSPAPAGCNAKVERPQPGKNVIPPLRADAVRIFRDTFDGRPEQYRISLLLERTKTALRLPE